MKRRSVAVPAAGVPIMFILACRAVAESAPAPLPEELRYATVALPEFFDRTPPPEWYEAIGERPIKEMLGEDGCYAVVRVERGFYEAHVKGHYVCVTFAFRDPKLDVVSRSLVLPRFTEDRGAAEGVYSLWRYWWRPEHRERLEAAKKYTRTLVETAERRSYLPDQGTPREALTARLARLGIGSLPSVMSRPIGRMFPVVSFVKDVADNKEVRWKKSFRSGGRKGDWPVWRVAAAARWPFGGRTRERSHAFAVVEPFRISDTRYEDLLMTLAEFSDVLKGEIEKKHRSYTKWVATHAGETAAESPAAGDDAPAAGESAPTGFPVASASEDDGWPPWLSAAVSSGLAGVILGGALAFVLLRRRARQA